MLMDRFNRIINYIRISVTDRCNLRCRYCVDGEFPFVSHTEILSYEEIIRFVRICAELGVNKVRLTGGEPLVRKGVASLLKEITAISGVTDISLTTNGVYLGERIAELREAGLKRVNISLDSLKRERFAHITGVDAFQDVMKSIETAREAGLNPIKINTVIIKGFNDDEVLDFAQFARDRNLSVRFIEFMPFGESELWDSSKIVPSQAIEEQIRRVYDLEPSLSRGTGPAKMFKIRDSKGRVGFISPVSSHICSQCNRIRLTSSGMIRPCLFSDVEYDAKGVLRGGADDEAIKAFVSGIVGVKPEKKGEIGVVRKCQRSLQQIGG
jgi:cyclic pyranopterin phosphate synthase